MDNLVLNLFGLFVVRTLLLTYKLLAFDHL